MKDYNKVISLRKQGYSYNQIAEIVNISSTTAQLWVKTTRKPRIVYATQKQQRQMKSKSRKLTPELAYIYGVLIGDGCIEISPYSSRIALHVTDKDFAEKFYQTLKQWSSFTPTWMESIRISNHRTKYGKVIRSNSKRYTVRLGSKQIIKFITKKFKWKTKDWCVPMCIKKSKNKKIISYFLKGIFDSEGFPILDLKNRTRRIEIEMWGEQLKQIQELLKRLDIESTVIKGKRGKGRGTYILRIIRKESIKLFAKHINFTIKRKNKKLSELLNSYLK